MMHEGHITICDDPGYKTADVFKHYAHSIGLKPIFIKLGRGEFKNQLMAGIKYYGLSDTEAGVQLGLLAGKLSSRYSVRRIKLESAAPLAGTHPAKYYECHYKLAAPSISIHPRETYELAASKHVDKFNEIFGSGFSYNAYTGEWYLTLRSEVYPSNNFERFDAAVRYKFSVINSHYERVVIDTNPDLDRGWLESPSGGTADTLDSKSSANQVA